MNDTTTEQPTKTTDTPADNWADWALLQHYFNFEHRPSPQTPLTAAELCADRLHKLVGQNPDAPVAIGKRSFIITTNGGHWGRGATLADAAKQAIKAGARKTEIAWGCLVLNDDTPEVNQGGNIISNSDSHQCNLGKVGKVGGLL